MKQWVLILIYYGKDTHLIYFSSKKKAKKAFLRFKKEMEEKDIYYCKAILTKLIDRFEIV